MNQRPYGLLRPATADSLGPVRRQFNSLAHHITSQGGGGAAGQAHLVERRQRLVRMVGEQGINARRRQGGHLISKQRWNPQGGVRESPGSLARSWRAAAVPQR